LLAEGIDLHATHTVIGYGNTPWSRGPVEFSTVDWNLETIAEETCRMIASDAAPRHVSIPPRLVVRGNQPPKSKTSP
jgi:DNA-binding LacI/PurR family transcriptional regulator